MPAVVHVKESEYVRILGGESTPRHQQAQLVNVLLGNWAMDKELSVNWQEFAGVNAQGKLQFDFDDTNDAMVFWKHWVAPPELKDRHIFSLVDMEHVSNAIDWIRENIPLGKYEFIAPFSGCPCAVAFEDDTKEQELATYFKLTYVGR